MAYWLQMLLGCTLSMGAVTCPMAALAPVISRRYSQRTVYALLMVVLLGFLIPWRPVLPRPAMQSPVPAAEPAQAVPHTAASASLLTMGMENAEPIDPAQTDQTVATIPRTATQATKAPARPLNINGEQLTFLLWAVGVAAVLARVGWRHHRFLRLVNRWSVPAPARAQKLLAQIVQGRKAPALFTCAAIDSPMVTGVLRPRLLLPESDASDEDLLLIYRHEWTHFRRGDVVVKLLIVLAKAIHWMNPAVYLLSREMNLYCETSCDEVVLTGCDKAERRRYAETVMSVMTQSSLRQTALCTGFQGGLKRMKRRILYMLDTRNKKNGVLLLVVLLMLSILSGAALAVENETTTQALQPTLSISDIYHQAQSGWHQSYDTARGETVAIDIDVIVPAVSAFPCYYAEDMQPVNGVPTSKNDLAEYGEAATINNPGFFRYDWPNRSIQQQWRTAARKNGTMLETFGEPRALVLRYGHFDMDTAYSVNNPSTMRDAGTFMAECVQTFFSDQAIELIPHWLHAHIDPGKYKKNKAINDYEKVQDDPNFQGCLFTFFDQTIDGIPVLGYGYQGFADYKGAGMRDENKGILGGICITQGMREIGREELYRSLQLKLISVTDLIAEDVPFCSLDAVIQTAEQLINAGQLRTVDSLRLGYVVWFDQTNVYKLMPTWVIEGELFANAMAGYRTAMTILTDTPSEYANVYINAQTGELIDPWKSNKNRAYDAPNLITWR